MNSAFSFPLLGYPVEVSWTAILILGFISFASAGGDGSANALASGLVWGAVIFFSILVHELGHAVVGGRLGLRPQRIVLHGFGGLCQFGTRPTPGKGVISSLAGPGAGILLGLLSWAALAVLPSNLPPGVGMTLGWLVQINLFWSLFNLAPMYPLDGGAVVYHGLSMFIAAPRAWQITRVLSIVTAVIVGALGLWAGMRFIPILAVLLIFQNWRR